jgi:tRNA(Arg) A34 adenosine deaminase TadA
MQVLYRFTARSLATETPVPFGAAVVNTRSGECVARVTNAARRQFDATCHAEVRAIRLAGKRLRSHLLRGHSMFTTCEPCPMCMSAILWAGLDRVVFGATIKDASRHVPQIHISPSEILKRSDLQCAVAGPIERELCYSLFTHPRMLLQFESWRKERQ